MINLVLYFIFIIMILSPITYSFLILFKSIIQYPSFYEIQLLISSIFLIIWTIIVIPIYITPENFSNNHIVLIEHIATIIGSFGVLFFVFSIINNFSYKLVIFPRLTIIGFSIIIGSKAIQLTLEPAKTLYGIKIVENQTIRVTPLYFSIFIGLIYLVLYITLIIFIVYQNRLPDYIIPEKTKQYSTVSLVIFTMGIGLQSIGTLFISDAFLAGWFLILSRLFITLGFIFIVLQFIKNPILTLSEKGNPSKFISNGTINWLLLGNRNFGPEALHTSPKLHSFFTQEELQLFTVKLLTSVSLGKEEYTEEICIIPHGNTQKGIDLVAVGFSFLHVDPALTDSRKKGLCELLFAIIIPSVFLPFLVNITIDSMRKPISTELKKTQDLNEFLSICKFNLLTAKLLKNLTQKKSF